MTSRRIIIATTAALLAAGTVGAASAHADADASPAPPSAVHVASDDYIACAGLETVNVAVCVESPTGPVIDLLRRP